jgi:hypothetical protein
MVGFNSTAGALLLVRVAAAAAGASGRHLAGTGRQGGCGAPWARRGWRMRTVTLQAVLITYTPSSRPQFHAHSVPARSLLRCGCSRCSSPAWGSCLRRSSRRWRWRKRSSGCFCPSFPACTDKNACSALMMIGVSAFVLIVCRRRPCAGASFVVGPAGCKSVLTALHHSPTDLSSSVCSTRVCMQTFPVVCGARRRPHAAANRNANWARRSGLPAASAAGNARGRPRRAAAAGGALAAAAAAAGAGGG